MGCVCYRDAVGPCVNSQMRVFLTWETGGLDVKNTIETTLYISVWLLRCHRFHLACRVGQREGDVFTELSRKCLFLIKTSRPQVHSMATALDAITTQGRDKSEIQFLYLWILTHLGYANASVNARHSLVPSCSRVASPRGTAVMARVAKPSHHHIQTCCAPVLATDRSS